MHTHAQSLTSDENGKRRVNEWTASSDRHEGTEHSVGNLVGIKRFISLEDLNEARDDSLKYPGTSPTQAHDQGDTTNGAVDYFAWYECGGCNSCVCVCMLEFVYVSL